MPNVTAPSSVVSTSRRKVNDPFGAQINVSLPAGEWAARNLRVKYIRPVSKFIRSTWDATQNIQQVNAIKNNGWGMVMTLTNTDDPSIPLTGTTDINNYKTTVGTMLDTYKDILSLVVVGNEATLTGVYFRGSPAEYEVELTAAAEVCKGRGIKVANDGMVNDDAGGLVWANFMDLGDLAGARDFARRHFSGATLTILNALTDWRNGPASLKASINRSRAMLDVYKRANVDYINLHIYTGDEISINTVIDFFEKQTGKQVISNETGQQVTLDPVDVRMKMVDIALKRQMPFMIWYSPLNPSGNAQVLTDTNGVLNADGNMYRIVKDNFFPSNR